MNTASAPATASAAPSSEAAWIENAHSSSADATPRFVIAIRAILAAFTSCPIDALLLVVWRVQRSAV